MQRAGDRHSARGARQHHADPAVANHHPANHDPPPRTTTPPRTTLSPPSVPVFDAAIGDCVSLAGTENAPEISHQQCGSAQANYKVVAVTASHDRCPGDADGWYANTLNDAETAAFCLDVDWVVGDCYTLTSDWPARVDCAGATTDAVRLASIGPGTDGSICGERSHVYTERRIIACLDSTTRSG